MKNIKLIYYYYKKYKLNTKEMKQLIEIIKYWAEDLGIETNEEYFTE